MALTPNLVKTSVSSDGENTILTDATVYGSANPDRNEVAVYVKGYKVDEDQVESALTIDPFDPESAVTFTVTNDIDGHYRFYFVIVDNWLVGTEYEQYDVVWSPTENKFYEYINATPSTGNLVTNIAYFAELTDPTEKIEDVGTDEESGNLTYQIYETVIDYVTAKCYATAVLKQAKENCGQDDDCGCSSKIGKAVRRLHVLLTGMQVANARERYLEAERMARKAEKYCDDCGCLNQ